jgi:hypothetical protein
MTPASLAWSRVLHAIEDAIDVDDLQAPDRAALARLHAQAERRLGINSVCITSTLTTFTLGPAYGPGGVNELGRHGAGYNTLSALRRGKLQLVFDVADAADDQLLAISGIGPARVREIRKAIAAWAKLSPEDFLPKPAPGPPKPSPWNELRARSKGPGGTDRLAETGCITSRTYYRLLDLKLALISDVEQADRDGRLTPANGIGPRVLNSIRDAIAKHRDWASLVERAAER